MRFEYEGLVFPTTEKKQAGQVLKDPRKTAGGRNKNHGLKKSAIY